MNILDIQNPKFLKKLKKKELEKLSTEIRQFLIDKVSKNGGHLSSNLGIVDLTIAIHKVFDSPKDKIIFDVGHQSYTHKILTGRKDGFINKKNYYKIKISSYIINIITLTSVRQYQKIKTDRKTRSVLKITL